MYFHVEFVMFRVESSGSLYQTASGTSTACSSPGGSYTAYQTPAEKAGTNNKLLIYVPGSVAGSGMFIPDPGS
jgi:hypothetical protein